MSFRYSANVPVLHDITFSAAPGQVIALLGSTGSGKSTIAQLMPRFYDVTSGCITIDGVDIRTYQVAALRQHIGIVMQDTLLFSTTIRDNIAYGREDLDLETVIAAAKAARAHDFIMQCSDGYDTWVGERGVTLSGGQRQRIAMARAFARNPRLLILDDATSSVDMETEYLMQQALTELMAGRTTFVIAQRLRTLKQADTILVLEDGRIVQRGTHDDCWPSQVSTAVSTTCNCVTRRISGSMPRVTGTHSRSTTWPHAGYRRYLPHEGLSTQSARAMVQADRCCRRRATVRESLRRPRRASPVAVFSPIYQPAAPGHGLYVRGVAESSPGAISGQAQSRSLHRAMLIWQA